MKDLLGIGHANLQPRKVARGPNRALVGAVGAKPLRDADRRDVQSLVLGLFGNCRHPGAANEADGFLPVLDQKGQQNDVETNRGVLEHPATGPLKGTGGDGIGHLALGAQDAAEVVFHPDSPRGPLFELCLEELHGYATWIALVLGVAVLEDMAVITTGREG